MQDLCRVLLADDHRAMQDRVRALLEPEFDVVGAAEDGRALVDMARMLNPDVLVVDVSMPELNGIDAVREIKRAGSTAKIVFLTVHEDPEILELCFDVGAQAYVIKSRLASDLIPAIQFVLSGRTYVSPILPRRLAG